MKEISNPFQVWGNCLGKWKWFELVHIIKLILTGRKSRKKSWCYSVEPKTKQQPGYSQLANCLVNFSKENIAICLCWSHSFVPIKKSLLLIRKRLFQWIGKFAKEYRSLAEKSFIIEKYSTKTLWTISKILKMYFHSWNIVFPWYPAFFIPGPDFSNSVD